MSTVRRMGREARTAARAAGLPPELRPVWPGMEGGAYAPLGAGDVTRIHRAALAVLEDIGLSDAPPSGVALLTAAGAVARHVRLLGTTGRSCGWLDTCS
jgi:trimethylamine--corrinoid protein Co-methyltransferase